MPRTAYHVTAIVLVFIAVFAAPWSASATARSGEAVTGAEDDGAGLVPTWGAIAALTVAGATASAFTRRRGNAHGRIVG